MTQPKIIFTGGGTAGHVTPNLALIKKFQQECWDVAYIGSQTGIEKELITKIQVPYYAIATGKLRRYFSLQNFLDPFKIVWGVLQATWLIYQLKPQVVFSKGGFVALPVVVAAWLNRVPAVIHESDLTLGLTNKLCLPFAQKICVAFPSTAQQIHSNNQVVVAGTPLREDFLAGDAKQGRQLCGFTDAKKIILVFGGSLGSSLINQNMRSILPQVLADFNVIHICGPGGIDNHCQYVGYKQFEYLHADFAHILAAADLVIARAGANSIYELIAAKKPNILIPLAAKASRGDQIINAHYCAQHGYSVVIAQEQLTPELLLAKIHAVVHDSDNMIKNMHNFSRPNSVEVIYQVLITSAKKIGRLT